MYWSEQSFTGLRPEDGAHHEDCMFLTVNIWKTCNGEAYFYYTSKTPIESEEELYTVNNRQNIYKERCLQTARIWSERLTLY